MFSYLWPIGLVVLSNVFYNLITKATPSDANAFLSLSVTYAVAAIFTLIIAICTAKGGMKSELGKLNWTSIALGIDIVGLELGYIFVYRAGWSMNVAPLIMNITLSCILIFVGWLLFKETLTWKQGIGIACCLVGLVLIS